MLSRQAHLDLFTSYELPVVNLTAECDCQDFVTPAKACGLPPFALLLHGIAKASMAVENFRCRIFDGQVQRVERLAVSHTVVGADTNLNFSTFPFDENGITCSLPACHGCASPRSSTLLPASRMPRFRTSPWAVSAPPEAGSCFRYPSRRTTAWWTVCTSTSSSAPSKP